MRHKSPSTNIDDYSYAIKIIPLMRKFIKKHPWSGELVAEEGMFKYDYKIVGMTFNTNYYEPELLIHIEISNFRICRRYMETNVIKWEKYKFAIWSAIKRNEYVRSWGLSEIKLFTNLFSFPYRIGIGKIKLIDDE